MRYVCLSVYCTVTLSLFLRHSRSQQDKCGVRVETRLFKHLCCRSLASHDVVLGFSDYLLTPFITILPIVKVIPF